jgi:hypothetical protein
MDMRLVQIGVEVLRRQNSVVSVMTLYEKTKFETTCMSARSSCTLVRYTAFRCRFDSVLTYPSHYKGSF